AAAARATPRSRGRGACGLAAARGSPLRPRARPTRSIAPDRRPRPAGSVLERVEVDKPAAALLLHADARETHLQRELHDAERAIVADGDVGCAAARVRP